jgi:hypothetical protein
MRLSPNLDHFRYEDRCKEQTAECRFQILGLLQLMLILITDRCGYLPLLVERQLCIVHLLRDIKIHRTITGSSQKSVFGE